MSKLAQSVVRVILVSVVMYPVKVSWFISSYFFFYLDLTEFLYTNLAQLKLSTRSKQ